MLVLCLSVGTALFMSSCEKPLLPDGLDDGTRATADSTKTGGNVGLTITVNDEWEDTTYVSY